MGFTCCYFDEPPLDETPGLKDGWLKPQHYKMEHKLTSKIITQHPISIILYLFKLIVQTFIQKSTFMRELVPTCTKCMPDIQKENKSKCWVLAQWNTNVLATFHHKTIKCKLFYSSCYHMFWTVFHLGIAKNILNASGILKSLVKCWAMIWNIYILQLCKIHCHGN